MTDHFLVPFVPRLRFSSACVTRYLCRNIYSAALNFHYEIESLTSISVVQGYKLRTEIDRYLSE